MLERLFWVRLLNPAGCVRYRLVMLGAQDEQTARLLVEQDGALAILYIIGLPQWLGRLWTYLEPLTKRKLPPEELGDFFHNLGIMLKSGLPIDGALRELRKDTTHPGIRKLIGAVTDIVVAGHPMSLALARYEHQISSSVRALVTIGEQTGDLGRVLAECATHVKRMRSIQQDIARALYYPIFAALTTFGAMLFWVYYVLPDLARMFKQMGAKLPTYTLAMMDLVQHLKALTGSTLWLGAATVFILLALLVRDEGIRYRGFRLLYALPVSGKIIKAASLAFITEYLALLLSAGLPLIQALEILERAVRNVFYARKIADIRAGVTRGNSLSMEMARAEVFPAMVIRLVSVGEQTGTLDSQLRILADDYRQKLDHVIATLGEIIKPALIVVAGAFFLFVVVVFLLPVYQLISQVMR